MAWPAAVILPLSAAAAAAVVLAVALRGRRVDDHPHCRKCGFDLHGKPADSTRCPECGADLGRRRAVRIGRRERHRRRFVMAATAAVLAAGGWLGLVGWQRARGVDWEGHKPAWWLAREADGRDVVARDAALAELARRVAAGTLPPDREAALVATALEYQRDPDRPWVPGWGRIVEAARAAGRLSDEQWLRYGVQSVTFVLGPRTPHVRRGESLEIEVHPGPFRTSTGYLFGRDRRHSPFGRFNVGVYSDGRARFDDRPRGRAVKGFVWPSMSSHSPTMPPDGAADEMLPVDGWVGYVPEHPSLGRVELSAYDLWGAGRPADQLAAGPHAVRVSFKLRALEATGIHDEDPFRFAPGERWVEASTVVTFDPPVRLATDPALAPAVRRSVSAGPLTLSRGEKGWRVTGPVAFDRPPIGLAFHVKVRRPRGAGPPAGGKDAWAEWSSDGGFVAAGQAKRVDLRTPWYPRAEDLVADSAGVVDVVLRPSPMGAPADMAEMWGGDVVIEDVPIRRPTPP